MVEEAALMDRLLFWMQENGPEEWHKVVCSYNWDNGMAPLLWLVDQEGLDRATAHTMFWLTAPEWFLLSKEYMEGGRDIWEAGEQRVCQTLLGRAQSGTITGNRFATAHGMAVSAESWLKGVSAAGGEIREFELPAWMHEPISGEEVDLSDMDEGFPKSFFVAS